jgi:hypothetical protein
MKKIIFIIAATMLWNVGLFAQIDSTKQADAPLASGINNGTQGSDSSSSGTQGSSGSSSGTQRSGLSSSSATHQGRADDSKVKSIILSEHSLMLETGENEKNLTFKIDPVKAKPRLKVTYSNNNVVSGEINFNTLILTPDTIGKTTIFITDSISGITDSCVITVRLSYVALKAENDTLIAKYEELKNKPDNPISETDKYRYALLVVIVALVCAILVIFKSNTKSKKQKKFEDGLSREQDKQIYELQQKIASVEEEKSVIEQKLRQSKSEFENLSKQSSRNSDNSSVSSAATPETAPPKPHPQSLYAKTIVDGKFNRVQEQANEETVFELKLSKPNDTRAIVIVYSANHKLVISHPEFLEGCEVQNLGNTTVTMLREGVAQKESDGKWKITTVPEVKIS